ncbi:MAG: protein BatD [Muribaculaceae bacterium]|nr:protein BatD [Muribaculaceae bacterium]
MKKYISLVVILIFSTITIYSQTKFAVEAPGQVIAGQRFRVVYTLTNGDGEGLNVPPMDGITILYGPARSQSSQFSIVNGKTSSTKEESYTYTVIASKEGSYTIPAATINSEGKQYTSNSLTIKVLPDDGTSSNSKSTNSQAVNQNSGDDKTFARMILSKTSVYEQEPILVTFKIYTKAANIRSLDNATFPSFEGFVLQDIPIENPQIELEHYQGVNYQVVTIKRALLYPQRSGNIEISKGDFEVSVQVVRPMQSFFGVIQGYADVEKSISTSAQTVKVKPLPANKPASFTNAVGSFKIKSSISNTTPKANEALTYKLVISGNGNLKYIKDPELKFPGDFEVYDPKTEVDVKTTTSGVTGSRIIEYTVIPRSAGDFKIPPVEFSYFDIATQNYKTIQTDSYELKVAKGAGQSGTVADFTNKTDLKVLATDIRYIKGGEFSLAKDDETIFGSLVYWLYYIIPTLIFIGYIIINRKQAQLNSNVDLLKNRKANKVASKRLKVAATYLKTYNKEKFYAEVLKAILGYISDKLTIPISELSRDNVSQELKSYGATDELVSKIINIIDLCEFAQYTPSQSNETMDNLYKDLVSVIGEMENIVKNR